MSDRSYKNIFNNKGTLWDVYTDFLTPEQIAVQKFKESSDSFYTEGAFKTLLDLLFPRSLQGFYEGTQFFDKLMELTTAQEEYGSEELKSYIAKQTRFYYYNGTTSDNTEKKVGEFYKENRPSAYNAYKAEKYDHIENPLRQIFQECKVVDSDKTTLRSALSMILVDTPHIDLKLKNADIVSTFLNYTPGVMASQMVPYLDVRFSLSRRGVEADKNIRPNKTMTPLRFLLGDVPLGTAAEDKRSATDLIYDAYTTSVVREAAVLDTESFLAARNNYNVQQAAVNNKQPPPVITNYKKDVKETLQTTTTGMEMFLMPQTLINMDYDSQTTPRYHDVLNSTIPFGSIISFNINVTSAGYGVFSYKTGILTLKIFDRSRLSEIADFLNPKLYSQATLFITYGWRAPSQPASGVERNEYASLINEHMLKKEVYGISNSSISIGDDGGATVTLNLFMKFSHELSQITPTDGAEELELQQQAFNANLDRLRELAEELGLGNSGAKDLRGSTLIRSALGGSIPSLDSKGIKDELSAIKKAFENSKNPTAREFFRLAEATYQIAEGGTRSQAFSEIEASAKSIASSRFNKLKQTDHLDVWSILPEANAQKSKFSSDVEGETPEVHPLTRMHKFLLDISKQKSGIPKNNKVKFDSSFGNVSFARLFAVYFASAAKTAGDLTDANNPEIDEYQIIFYNFNQFAGLVANVNIGEFPIDVDLLTNAYSEYITKQKGEKMTFLNFLEIVRSSQFGNLKHRAFGFSDLYDDKSGDFKKDHVDEKLKREMDNHGLGGPFVPPAVDFYIETSSSSNNAVVHDLLSIFETNSVISTSKKKPDGYKKIVRIHIYDKAAIPHKAAYDILRTDSGAFVEVDNSWQNKYKQRQKEILQNINKIQDKKAREKALDEYNRKEKEIKSSEDPNGNIDMQIELSDGSPVSLQGRSIVFKGKDGKSRFDLVKREISRFVPTITFGTNGTLIKSINYGSEQDAMLSTIMMIRNSTSAENPSSPNGSQTGDLPLRVIPGKLSMSTFGCPLFEYMQQFFIDLGTGTTVDNLYNITGLTHNITQGSFFSEIQFTFADAYGKYESTRSYTKAISALAKRIDEQANQSQEIQNRNTTNR